METENRYITVAYRLYTIENDERDFTEEAPRSHPFQFISGLGLTLEAFEKRLVDLPVGDRFDFKLPCADAYGEYDDDHLMELPKEIFLVDGKFDTERITEGAIVPLMTEDGQRVNGTVNEIKDDVVVVDFNHPLAGCVLHFMGEVMENRPATPEEITALIHAMSGRGCGGKCGGCGDGCDCDGGCC